MNEDVKCKANNRVELTYGKNCDTLKWWDLIIL